MSRITIKSRVRDAQACLNVIRGVRTGRRLEATDVSAIFGVSRWLEQALDTPDTQEREREFHEAFDLVVRDTPGAIPEAEMRLRLRLLGEEVGELVGAMCGFGHDASAGIGQQLRDLFEDYADHAAGADVAEVAREQSDLLGVVYGTALHYGFDQDAAFAEVMAACMRKLGPDGVPLRRADGKVLKPPGWVAPDVAAAIGLDRSAA